MARFGETEPRHERIPPSLLARAVKRRSVLNRERVDAVTVEVLGAFSQAGIRAIVLKGPVTVSWLYGEDTGRGYVDADILISPDDLDAAGRALEGLGFDCVFDDREHGANPHAQMWRRAGSSEVDLHWQLPGIGVEPSEAWRILRARTESFRLGALDVEALDAPARALHLAIHAASHQRPDSHARLDLVRALDQLPDEVWREAGALAHDLRAEAAAGAGLRSVPSGAGLADRLGLTREGELAWAIAGGRAIPGVHAIHRAGKAGSKRSTLEVLARELFPPRSYMRAVTPGRDLSGARLAAAYLARLARGLRNAPAALWTTLQRDRANPRR